MALATVADVEVIIGPDFDDDDAQSLLEEASDLVSGYLLWAEPPADVPDAVTRAVARIAATALTGPPSPFPEGTQATAGPYGIRVGGDTSRVYLTNALRLRLRPYRASMASVALGSERYT